MNTATATAAGLALTLAACGNDVDVEGSANVEDRSGDTLVEIVSDQDTLSTLAGALEATGINGALEGEASYTLFAPTDDALSALGPDTASFLDNKENGAIVAAVLREHMVPGALTPDNIKDAIEANGGEVTMVTFGSDNLTLSMDGEKIIVKGASGSTAGVIEPAYVGSNGVVVPIDAILTDASALQAANSAESP